MRNILIHEHKPSRARPHEDAGASLGIEKELGRSTQPLSKREPLGIILGEHVLDSGIRTVSASQLSGHSGFR